MSHGPVRSKMFVGKTIESVDCRAVNILRFYFTDGTAIALETDAVGIGIYGIVACETCAKGKGDERTRIKPPRSSRTRGSHRQEDDPR